MVRSLRSPVLARIPLRQFRKNPLLLMAPLSNFPFAEPYALFPGCKSPLVFTVELSPVLFALLL